MILRFHLGWHKVSSPISRSFKTPGTYELFTEYVNRINPFCSTQISGAVRPYTGGIPLWICHPAAKSKPLSSEDLAAHIQTFLNHGIKEWAIAIGGADGFSDSELSLLRPSKLWTLGPMVYPHELAAIIVSEQIYRAFTIIKGHPYHLGH